MKTDVESRYINSMRGQEDRKKGRKRGRIEGEEEIKREEDMRFSLR
jgi:hypothetical protein